MELVIAVIIALILFPIFMKQEEDKVIGKIKSKDQLLNKDLAEELARKISEPEYRERILEIVTPDLVYVYGEEWEKIFNHKWNLINSEGYFFGSPENIIHMLLLSRSGVIPPYCKYNNFSLGNAPYANAYERLLILQCVERNIREKVKDTKLKLYFYPNFNYEGIGKHRKAIPDYEHPSSGHVRWNFDDFNAISKYGRDLYNSKLIQQCKEHSLGERSLKTPTANPYKDILVL